MYYITFSETLTLGWKGLGFGGSLGFVSSINSLIFFLNSENLSNNPLLLWLITSKFASTSAIYYSNAAMSSSFKFKMKPCKLYASFSFLVRIFLYYRTKNLIVSVTKFLHLYSEIFISFATVCKFSFSNLMFYVLSFTVV